MREGNFKGMWDRLVHSGEAATGVFLFLEISQNSQQNTSSRASFLIKLQAEACKTLAQVLLFELWSNIYDGPYYVWLSCRCRRATLLKWTPSQTFFAAESNSWSFRWCLLFVAVYKESVLVMGAVKSLTLCILPFLDFQKQPL